MPAHESFGRALAGTIASLALDVTAPDAGDRILNSCIEKLGRAAALFLCAGIYSSASLEDTTDEMWDRVHTLNLKSAFRICRAFAPHVESELGPVIHVSADRVERLAAGVPIGRGGTAEEVAHSIMYLLDDVAASYVTGAILDVAGGR
ncbi:hypothetical protein DFJ74DRAFT_702265 [Hyaloraphidium curvatum]|nr:hypothetical protein DFJ74DRAFT_702265 [Hyaloraphidium curvatum]